MSPRIFGILLFLLALLLFAILDASAKYLTAFYAVPFLVWARYAVHLVVMLVAVAPSQGRALVTTGHPWLMLVRGLLLCALTLFAQLAFRVLPLAETTDRVFRKVWEMACFAGFATVREAAVRLQGASPLRIILGHVVPMCIPSVVVRITLNMASIILTAAALGFGAVTASPASAPAPT